MKLTRKISNENNSYTEDELGLNRFHYELGFKRSRSL